MAAVLRGDAYLTESDGAPRPATFTFSDMGSQGDDYVRDIRAQAAEIIRKAKAEADGIRKKAEAEGIAAAESQMAQRLDQRIGAELNTLRPAIGSAVAQIQEARGEWLTHWRDASVRLSVAMAERILRRELAADPTISEAWLTEALQLAAGSSEVTVRLSPHDYKHLREHAESLAESMSGLGEARFVEDPGVSQGGCRVETRHGAIDQQLETQLDRLTEELG